MFLLCSDKFAIMAATRCGHTNMYHYFGIWPYDATGYTLENWKEHHNPIVVLRNPLDRLISSLHISNVIPKSQLYLHSQPYMHTLDCDFRIIDFYDLEQYIPRSKLMQSPRSDSRADDSAVAEDLYVPNDVYSLDDLREELKIYKNLMKTRERVSVEEWKELTT